MNRIDSRIERNCLIGMIVSDDFIKQIRPFWNQSIMKGTLGNKIAKWCMQYFDKYGQAPKQTLEAIYLQKLKDKRERIDDDLSAEIEDFLEDLSEEYERNKINVQYYVDQATEYFTKRHLEEHQKKVDQLLSDGKVDEANALMASYVPPSKEVDNSFDFRNKEQLFSKIEALFAKGTEPLFKLPGAIGDMMNEFFVRDSFIALLAPEKTGKSTWLLHLAMQALKQKCNVAFFQAGDMSELQQLRRIAINRSRKNDNEKYCGEQWIPVKDCYLNQIDECDLPERESFVGVFSKTELGDRKEITRDKIMKKIQEGEDEEYSPCHNCLKYRTQKLGSVWFKKKDFGDPLTEEEAKTVLENFFIKKKRNFRMATYANETLTVKEVESMLTKWEENDGFVADVIIIDYADIMVDFSVKDFRQRQNAIWSALRGLSQKKHSVLITATQGDAKSYNSEILTKKNFSEDKRKIAHVTALFGLNQTTREKQLKIMRINKIAVRDGDFNEKDTVTVLQNLAHINPAISSFL